MTRLATMTYALLLACFLALVAAPAHAQLPLDPVGTVGDVVNGGGTSGGGSSGGGGGGGGTGSTDPTGGLTGTVGDVLNDDGKNSSSDTGSDEPSGDGGLIGGVIDTVEKTTSPVKDPVKETVDNGTQTLDDTSGGLTEGYLGGVTGTVDKTLDDPEKTVKKVLSGDKGKDSSPKTRAKGDATGNEDVFGKQFQAALDADQKRRAADAIAIRATSAAVAEEPEANVVQQIGRVAAEAAEQMAFPVILLMMVGAFLIGQNRVDRRDPKLALAPVDLDADLLSFT